MASKAAARWNKLCYGRIPEQVGTFFEQLTLQLMRGISSTTAPIDLEAWSIDSGIEVKGGDNTHSFRIPFDQLERHAGLADFPFSYVLYYLYRYNNRMPHGGTGLSRVRGAERRSLFLFRKMLDLTVLDHRILRALARTAYSVRGNALPMDPERMCLILPSTTLFRLLSAEWPKEMKRLKLDPASWKVEQRMIGLEAIDGLELHRLQLCVRFLVPAEMPHTLLFKNRKNITIRLPDLEL